MVFNIADEKIQEAQLQLFESQQSFKASSAHRAESRTVPLFSPSAYAAAKKLFSADVFTNFGLFARQSTTADDEDSRIFLNTNAPWSAFICGSQGSGKSYSLSAMLENCLLLKTPSNRPALGPLQNSCSGLVFHYDIISAGANGIPCEAASLASLGVKIQVLVSLTNLANMKQVYNKKLGPNIEVKPLLFKSEHLDVKTMMTLMAADDAETAQRLYMHTVRQCLRDTYWESDGHGINFDKFINKCKDKITTPTQRDMLDLRIQLIESFIKDLRPAAALKKGGKAVPYAWTAVPGQLTVVDLSCPFVDADTACNLFDICLGLFQKQNPGVSKVIALDEAHKFMTTSPAAQKLTESVKTAIRMQRHRALRVIVATQEPTISPSLLDLCSITLIHRFSSPDWYTALKGHLAAVAINGSSASDATDGESQNIFATIAKLNTGEALLCAPSAILDTEHTAGKAVPKKLGYQSVKIMVRERYSKDLGGSAMADGV